MQHSESSSWFTPAVHAGLTGTAVAAYAIHSSAWIAHQLSGVQAWPRPLELAYVITLVLWLSALALVYLGRAHSARATARAIDDERTQAQFVRAHQIALVVVVLAQIPFFVLDVPTKVLAQLTVTTSVVALAIAYAWLDR